jgi:hypothetical protein
MTATDPSTSATTTTSASADPARNPDPRRLLQVAAAIPLVYSADDVRVLQEVVIEKLETGPEVDADDLVTHIAQHFLHVFPALMFD